MKTRRTWKFLLRGVLTLIVSVSLLKSYSNDVFGDLSYPETTSSISDIKVLKTAADQLHLESSYQLALEKYNEILKSPNLSEDTLREIKFKIADCLWRIEDPALLEKAKKIFTELIDPKTQDQWWAQAHESFAQLYLSKEPWSHGNEIKQYLESARDFWAGETDLTTARQRFIHVSFMLGDFISQNWGWYYNELTPLRMRDQSINNATKKNPSGLSFLYAEILRVAESDADKSKAIYSLAMCYLNQYSNNQEPPSAEKYFKQVIEKYPSSEWVDDSYYQLGQYYENRNDFVSALTIYQKFFSLFYKGESQWVDNILSRVKEISSPNLRVGVGYSFLPGSEIQFSLGWRNLHEAQITFYKMDLVSQLTPNLQKLPTDSDYGIEHYSSLINRMVESRLFASLPVALSFKKILKDEGKHLWYEENKGLAEWQREDEKDKIELQKGILPPGTYLLVVSSGEKVAYDLVMVSDLGLVTKTAGHSALFFAFDSKSGAPRPAVKVKFHYRYYDEEGHWRFAQGLGETDSDGLLKADLRTAANGNDNNQHNLFACASDGTMQAFTQSNFYSYSNSNGKGAFWLYAFSDRPAYRPNEQVSFKGILRGFDGNAFSTPSSLVVQARIYDPRGNQVKEARYSLNEFGSFADTITLDDKAPLGEYRIQLWSDHWNRQIASAVLFRLEEYKLPEFLVNIKPQPAKEKSSSESSYRLGDQVDVQLDAQYYFGAPVAEAQVEYLIYQSPYYHTYYPAHPYEWYYSDIRGQRNYYNNGQLVLHSTVKTDSQGKAVFSFQTPKDSANDLRYHIEARVVDQSRREIRASADINVMRTSFLAYLNPKRNLYRPGDKALIEIKTLNGNDQPLSVEGKVSVSRNWWRESSGSGKSISPAHYDENELFTRFVKTNKDGQTTFEFQPEENGFYMVRFTGFDSDGKEVTAQTSVYVADKESKDIGYRYGGLQIIAERDTFSKGESAQVMLVADKPDTWVLLTAETDEIPMSQMVHLEGTVKLIEVPIVDSFVPNIFLTAVSAGDYQLKTHELQFIIPPQEQFLQVLITSDQETYQPQEKGTFEIQVTDKNGRPVQAEVGLGMVDSSVYYIQGEYASDIRQFFYGDKRAHNVQTQASFYQRRYVRLVRDENLNLLTEDERLARQRLGGEVGQEGWNLNGPLSQSGGSVNGNRIGGGKHNEEDSYRGRSDSSAARNSSIAEGFVGGAFEKKKELAKSLPARIAPAEPMGSGHGELAQPQIRSDFRSTVFWQPDIKTDSQGKAKITVQFPDSLTTWRTTARTITHQTAVGTITHETQTKKDIIVRLQSPRFFVERDSVTISANVHNYTDLEQKIKVSLQAKGLKLGADESVWITVSAKEEKRVDWNIIAEHSGRAQLTVLAQTERTSDAMTKSFAVLPHGIEKFIAQSVALKGDSSNAQTAEIILDVPQERIKTSTQLRLTLSPSLAASMLDALPFLADYPYGCVEQTMSRFLPAVIVAKTMRELGFSSQDADNYIENVLVPRGDPQGHPKRSGENRLSKLSKITQDGLNRLYDFQDDDGGWGWWKQGDSDRFMSAYVLWGLSLARDANIDVRSDVISRAVSYLQVQLVEEEDNPDMLAWMLQALASAKSGSKYEDVQTERLWGMRDKLNPYTRALFALSEFYRGQKERADILARNLSNGMKEDKDNKTVHWGESGIYYRFSEGGVEATALCLKALSNIAPQSIYLEPAVHWLVLNRRGSSWKNTRDTAIVILALTDYLKTSTELTPEYEYEIVLNGKLIKKGSVHRDNLFTFERYLDLPDDALLDGKNQLQIKMTGSGALYLSSYLKYFTQEEDISPAGNEVFVKRQYFHGSNKQTLLKGYVSDWKPLQSADHIESGDRIKVEMTIEAKNNYEYLMIEDYKPAGCEAVELKSGEGVADSLDHDGRAAGQQIPLYQEFRDQKTAFFISKLNQGKVKISYELRSEVPGEFHGLPSQLQAMYVPEIRANSAEQRVLILDK